MFHSDTLSGQCGWMLPQQIDSYGTRPQPVVFTADTDGKLKWSTPHMLSALVPEGEQYDYIRGLSATYLGTTGDSGGPVFL